MKPPPFHYHDPRTLEEAAQLMGSLDNARALAGGQSLVPMMNFRYAAPDHLVDLNGIPDLAFIKDDGEALTIGAMTRQRDIEFSDVVARRCPVLREALLNVGHRQTRNRGTLGGSLCHLDPAAELVSVMTLLDAVAHAASAGGATRAIPIADFALGFMTSALEPHELLSHVTAPLWPGNAGYAFEEFARRHGDFAIASAGVMLALDENGAVSRAAITLSGLGPTPIRLSDMEQAMRGQTLSDELVNAAVAAARAVEAMEDAHVTSSYRQHLAGVTCKRALRRAFARASQGGAS